MRIIDDGFVRTDLYALSTRCAFMIIDYGKVVLHMDSIVGAYLFALLTGNTGVLTDLFCNSAFIKRLATNMYHF